MKDELDSAENTLEPSGSNLSIVANFLTMRGQSGGSSSDLTTSQAGRPLTQTEPPNPGCVSVRSVETQEWGRTRRPTGLPQ